MHSKMPLTIRCIAVKITMKENVAAIITMVTTDQKTCSKSRDVKIWEEMFFTTDEMH